MQVLGLAYVRPAKQPIRRIAHLSLKESERAATETTTTTNERNYASVDDGERSLLPRIIARSAPIRENRAWMKNRHSARAIDSVARVALNMRDSEKRRPDWNCSTREFSTNVEFYVSNKKRDRGNRKLFARKIEREIKVNRQCVRSVFWFNLIWFNLISIKNILNKSEKWIHQLTSGIYVCVCVWRFMWRRI